MRIALSLLCVSSLCAPVLAASTQANRVARAAFAEKGRGTIDHAHEVTSINNTKEFVMGWRGAVTGPGAKGAYMMVVPTNGTRASMIRGTKISQDLSQAGRKLVRAHLQSQGLTGKIELGDTLAKHIPGGQWSGPQAPRLAQHPFTRDSGQLRYTVTSSKGAQQRYLVETNPKALLTGKGSLLGKVQLDTDRYGQHD